MNRNLSLLILSFLFGLVSFAQTEPTDFTGRDQRERERAPQTDQMNFVHNEILVKFKDNVQLKSGASLKSAGIGTVDLVLKNHGTETLEKLFPTETKLKSAKVVKDPQGRDMVIPSLHNIYKIVLPELKSGNGQPADIFKMIEELKTLPEVEYAEPNYIYSIDNLQPAGPVLTPAHLEKMQQNNNVKSAAEGVTPNDPLYEQQWYIPAIKANLVWAQTTGGSDQVIAILDTGVDTEHPDLKNKIWQNPGEIAGNGIDDDGNGLVDDIMGWDYINSDNDPKDDNSHGTHVAGIAAAETNNGIGIAGVNWQAKIMPLKVFQSSGRGDVAVISQGIIYATQKGATVINMSFGSYARSLAMEDALANAYATSVLVAAAGNDGVCIGPPSPPCFPIFPAALSFVLGVEANKQYPSVCGAGDPIIRACFSNFDPDGPVFSKYIDLLNYELKAPGVDIISCIPGGNYRVYNGTSMAAPIVAGAVSLYNVIYPMESTELIFGSFINTNEQHINVDNAINTVRIPKLNIVSYELKDTIDGDDDQRPDAGETINLYIKVRNTWAQANDVKIGIELGEFEDNSVVQILNNESVIGSISAYASRINDIPIKIKIANDVNNDRDIVLNLKSWYGNNEGLTSQTMILKVENGTELNGVMDSTLILTSDKFYIVNSSFRIGANGFLKVMPGTKMKFYTYAVNRGNFEFLGKKDSMIVIDGPGNIGGEFNGNGKGKYSYVHFINNTFSINAESLENCLIENYKSGQYLFATAFVKNVYIKNSSVSFFGYSQFEKCVFDNCIHWSYYSNTHDLNHCVYSKINNEVGQPRNYPNSLFRVTNDIINPAPNSFLGFKSLKVLITEGMEEEVNYPNQFWGTTNTERIKRMYTDFWSVPEWPILNIKPFLAQPSDSCHAHVWKVLVNGKDAQDEVVEPVGVGKQRFDVYFNRPMDKTFLPQVSFGVRYPYNQQLANEEGSWSEDSRIYTVYKTIKLTTGDGINRIRVSGAKEANGWDWEMPVEDQRFEFLISAASSASNEFMATPGLGKVSLEWNNNDLEDGLGYNMYRMEHINDSTLTEPVIINSSLITDTLYSDFSVVPNKKYYYYFKILRTNLEETDSSKIVAAIPFTAAVGDANGDLSVNVLDVTTIVAYLLNQNPQPFIFEAADVNGDEQINVLDIVATVNKVLNPGKSGSLAEAGTVNLYLQNDTLFADAPVPVGALQFDITGISDIGEIEKLKALQGFESGYSIKDNNLLLIMYSLTGKTIPAGNRIPLLKLRKGSGITGMIMGDSKGSPLVVNYLSTGLWNLRDLGTGVATLGQNYPNPFNQSTTIPITVNEPVDELVVRIINITGQEVALLHLKNPVLGENLLQWNTSGQMGMLVYRLEIMRDGKMAVAGVKKMVIQ